MTRVVPGSGVNVPEMVAYGKKHKRNKNSDYWYQDKNGKWHYRPKAFTEKFGGNLEKKVKEKHPEPKEGESEKDYRKRLAEKTANLTERRQTLRKKLLNERFDGGAHVKLAGSEKKLEDVRTAAGRLRKLRGTKGDIAQSIRAAKERLETSQPNTGDPDSMIKHKALTKRVQKLERQKSRIKERASEEKRIVEPYRTKRNRVLDRQFASRTSKRATPRVKEFDEADQLRKRAEDVVMTRGRRRKKVR